MVFTDRDHFYLPAAENRVLSELKRFLKGKLVPCSKGENKRGSTDPMLQVRLAHHGNGRENDRVSSQRPGMTLRLCERAPFFLLGCISNGPLPSANP